MERNGSRPTGERCNPGGELNAKYPCGIADLRKRLKAEGHRIVRRGKRYFVADFERTLVEPSAD